MDKKELITQHAEQSWEALYTCLDLYGIKYGVDYTSVGMNNSIMVMTYSLEMVNTSKWQKFKQLEAEISQALQIEKDSRVRINFEGLDYRIEVPKPKNLHDNVRLGDVFKKSQGLNISFGVSAYDNKPNAVDFSHNNAGHMLVSGATRCGKTNILKIIAMCLMYKNSPDNMRIALIDTVKSKGKYGALINSAHLVTDILNTEPKTLTFLRWVRDMIVKLEGRKYGKKIIIIIDEVYLLLKNKEVKELLAYIATAGAEVGFHIIAATQYTRADDVGGRQFKGNLMSRVCGRVDDHYSSKNATGKEGAGAENLMIPGDFLVVNNDGITRVAVPEIFDSHFKQAERGMSPIMKLNWDEGDEGTVPEAQIKTAPNIGLCFEKIDHRLLHLAMSGRNKRTNRPYGADVIRQASKVLENKGLGEAIGQGTANEYVKFAKKVRGIK